MLKVSVVVPTYKTPPEGLKRLVDSLDKQTLPASEFEVIFVDDGSPDDTLERLHAIEADRPNVRVEQIENSGWPSKPRNVGTDIARGEYIAYIDHDDEFYPDALRAGYEFAHTNGADALNGKEAYTHTPNWALGTYKQDQAQSVGRTDTHPLLPMNPHKLYRREFLIENGIRFPEGRKVFWEDVFFNLQVARHARTISTLASVPFYHWVVTKGSGSTTFLKWSEEYWDLFRRVLDATATELAGDEHQQQREQLMKHQYVSRVLGVFDGKFMTREPQARRFLFEKCRQIQSDFGMSRFDASLSSTRRILGHLLSEGDLAHLEQACVEDAQVTGWARATAVTWNDGVLTVEAAAEWSDDDRGTLHLIKDGDKLYKSLSPELAAVLDESLRDVSAELSRASVKLSVRSRPTRITWMVPTDASIDLDDADEGAVSLMGHVSARINPSVAALGHPLNSTHWDIFARSELGSWSNHRALRSDLPASVSLQGQHLQLVYPNDGGAATLIPDGGVEAVRRLSPLSIRSRADGGYDVVLSGEHDGMGRIATKVGIDKAAAETPKFSESAAVFRVANGHAVLQLAARATPFRVRVGDRAPGGPMWWTVGGAGDDISITPGLPSTNAKKPDAQPVKSEPAAPTKSTLRRRGGKVLRKLGLR